MSLNQRIGDDNAELGELFADDGADDPSEQAALPLQRRELREALSELPERERRVLELRYGLDGGLTRSRRSARCCTSRASGSASSRAPGSPSSSGCWAARISPCPRRTTRKDHT